MRKYCFVWLCLMLVHNVFAQNEEFRKPAILVNYFKNAGQVKQNEAHNLRASIMSSIYNSGRMNVIDIATESSLSEETKRRMREETIGDELARSGEMIQLGADLILNCTATNIIVNRKERKKDDKVQVYYEAKLTYGISIISTENGTVFFSRNYTTMREADTTSEARANVFNSGLSCRALNEIAPLEGEVIDTDYTVNKKGKKMETCYIRLGEIHGVHPGSYFNIDKVKYVAGEAIYERVGKLEVIGVHERISECKVFSNKEEVLTAMKDYLKMKTVNPDVAKPLRVRSRCDSGRIDIPFI